ncbi:type VI secretion system tube protein Hcp [Aquisalimonas sp. 2447]|uniref:Hcp family type VI secretion system effector n=1 Tax=Aquisalimonas sp. 2447 TaxID=2740807 RepID=UPI0014328095|nr:type VI secretion system tube protein Hcp [Aquisalimonas sp. 2447]QIT55936.1 type VI secretion system tube protein Hcp [Aquisalimonas sp. 2447]
MSIFMAMPNVQGSVADAGHAGWLPVETIEWGVQRQLASPSGRRGQREASNTEFHQLTVRRPSDRATPALVLGACCGRGQTVTLRFTRTGHGNGAEPYAEYVLHNALLSEYTVRARGRGNACPLETLRLSFTAVEMKYVGQDADGNAVAPVVVGFDSTRNRRS